MDKKVTIILANYNKQDFLNVSLDSIVGQSRFDEMEVIIVDDGSKDESVNIIKEYQEKYQNITLVSFMKGSGGPSKPRNTALDMVTTKYFIIMDPDDKVINDGYSTLLTNIEKHDSDILIAVGVAVDKYGKERFVDYIEKHPYTNSNDQGIKLDLLMQRPFIVKNIYSTALVNNNNIRFEEKLSTSEDEIFSMECVAHANKITKINDIVYQCFYEAEGSVTTKVALKIYEELPDIMHGIERVLKPMFSQEIISARIVGLLANFYIRKISFFTNEEDVRIACDLVYDACEKYGFEKLEQVYARDAMDLVGFIKDKHFVKAIARHYRKNLNQSNRQLRAYVTELRVEKRRNLFLRRTRRRRLIRLASKISRFKKRLIARV